MAFKAKQTKCVPSAEEQKRTLSGKKKLKKTTLRNILSTPYADFWPIVSAQDEEEIFKTLRQYMKQVKMTKVSIPWSVMKTIPQEQRKAFRSTHLPSTYIAYRSHLVFGTNEVTKFLESNSVSSVLASSDADPKFLIKHIIDMCTLQKVPVLLIPNLKELLKETTGFASLTVGFIRNSNFAVIDKKIKEIFKNYQTPVDNIIPTRKQVHPETHMDVIDQEIDKSENNCVYLHRKSKTERAFVPELSIEREVISTFSEIKTKPANFISLGSDSVDVSTNKEVKNVKLSYKSLLLKRVTGNKNRAKKKIDQLKLKLK